MTDILFHKQSDWKKASKLEFETVKVKELHIYQFPRRYSGTLYQLTFILEDGTSVDTGYLFDEGTKEIVVKTSVTSCSETVNKEKG